jgi:hypothetical protein
MLLVYSESLRNAECQMHGADGAPVNWPLPDGGGMRNDFTSSAVAETPRVSGARPKVGAR